MKVCETYSHFNGLEFLQIRHGEIWKEVLSKISHSAVRDGRYDESSTRGAFQNVIATSFDRTHWQKAGAYYVKDRVSVDLQLRDRSEFSDRVFPGHLASFICNEIDVGIEVLPMRSLQAEISSGVAYYEGELYNLVRQGRGVPTVPLVILGVAP